MPDDPDVSRHVALVASAVLHNGAVAVVRRDGEGAEVLSSIGVVDDALALRLSREAPGERCFRAGDIVVVAPGGGLDDAVAATVVENVLALAAALQSSADLAAATRNFLTHLQHGQRAPLTALLGLGELAATFWDQWDDAAKREFVDDARHAAEHLYRLSDGLTDPATVSDTGIALERRPAAVGDLIVGAIEATRRYRGDGVEIRCRNDLTVEFVADPARIGQAITALIDNAVCFARAGSRVDVRVTEAGHAVTVDVVNSGEQLDADEAERAFDAFARGTPPPGRRFNGLGLGLTVARRIARAHGGDVTLEPVEGGMRARLTVPAGSAA